MKSSIEAGGTISSTAINSGVFTPLVIQMISVGEETGRIDELLLEVADFYDREVDYDLKDANRANRTYLACNCGGYGFDSGFRYLPTNVGNVRCH